MFCFLGLPGSGKGVQSVLFSERKNIKHIAPGVLLRKIAKEDKELDEQLKKGQFVDDDLVGKIILNEVKKCHGGLFIIDGYPRNYHQASHLNDLLKEAGVQQLKKIFIFECPDEVVINRLLNRKVCPACPRSFSKEEKICPNCDKELITRNDDYINAIKVRIDNSKRELDKIIKNFENKIVYIKADQVIGKVYDDILGEMKKCSTIT